MLQLRSIKFYTNEGYIDTQRKLENTQLRFVFLNFSLVCQYSLRWS